MIITGGIDVEVPKEVSATTLNWVHEMIGTFGKKTGEVFFLFCSDDHLLKMNQNFLNHDYYTDVITFDQSEDEKIISGEIYISVDRVSDNAEAINVAFEEELFRVMIHGVLHLIGFQDKSPEEIVSMRAAEQKCLSLYPLN